MKKIVPVASSIAIMALLCSFAAFSTEQEWISWGNKTLNDMYNPVSETDLQKWEIGLTPDHFVRLRKTFPHGRQEYFSFKLVRFADLEYFSRPEGTDTLELKTQADDIIYQTYEDPKGDLDSMLSEMDIPVKKLEPAQVDSLRQALIFLRDKTPAITTSQNR